MAGARAGILADARFFLLVLTAACSQPASGPRDGFLTSDDGARLYFRIEGSGVDTVVAVHGGPGAGMNAILPDLAPLAANRTVLYFDQRGGGRSELPTDTARLSADHFIQDLEAVRNYFGLSQMTVVAHSFGSVLVARYAQRYPNRLERIVFLGATGPRRSKAGEHIMAQYARADTMLLNRLFEPMTALMGWLGNRSGGHLSRIQSDCPRTCALTPTTCERRGDRVRHAG